MKKLILFLTLISITSLTHSQENKIESTGNVGIGTTTPTAGGVAGFGAE